MEQKPYPLDMIALSQLLGAKDVEILQLRHQVTLLQGELDRLRPVAKSGNSTQPEQETKHAN